MTNTTITATKVRQRQRVSHSSTAFGSRFLWIESFVFDTAASLCDTYDGGEWDFYGLSNGGFYMAPTRGDHLRITVANGFGGTLSSQAFGITCCLYAYSMLSFSPDTEFAELCARHYHLLLDAARQHSEALTIFRAID